MLPDTDGLGMTFRELLHPMTAEEFFAHAYGRLAVHIPGHAQKFVNTFSWEELNRLFNQPALWSARSMKMVLDGRDLPAAEFCSPGRNREGIETMLPDHTKVTPYLQRGATLVLDLIERLSPGIAALAASLEMVFGQLAVCNAYCSWQGRQGFSSHFDAAHRWREDLESVRRSFPRPHRRFRIRVRRAPAAAA